MKTITYVIILSFGTVRNILREIIRIQQQYVYRPTYRYECNVKCLLSQNESRVVFAGRTIVVIGFSAKPVPKTSDIRTRRWLMNTDTRRSTLRNDNCATDKIMTIKLWCSIIRPVIGQSEKNRLQIYWKNI